MLKSMVGMVAGIGVNQVVSNIVIATTPKNMRDGMKVLNSIGVLVIGGMVSHSVSKYVTESIDEMMDMGDYLKEEIKVKRAIKKEA